MTHKEFYPPAKERRFPRLESFPKEKDAPKAPQSRIYTWVIPMTGEVRTLIVPNAAPDMLHIAPFEPVLGA